MGTGMQWILLLQLGLRELQGGGNRMLSAWRGRGDSMCESLHMRMGSLKGLAGTCHLRKE